MEEFGAWLSAHRPSAATLLTVPHYQELMAAVAEALESKTSGAAWDVQSTFILSESGQTYLRCGSPEQSFGTK